MNSLRQKGHKYYFLARNCTRNHTFGMLVQFMVRGASTFMRAGVAPFDLEDVRAMYMQTQQRYQSKTSARDLFNSLPALMPSDADGIMRPATIADVYAQWDPDCIADIPYVQKIVALDRLMELPDFKWHTILAMFAEKTGMSEP